MRRARLPSSWYSAADLRDAWEAWLADIANDETVILFIGGAP